MSAITARAPTGGASPRKVSPRLGPLNVRPGRVASSLQRRRRLSRPSAATNAVGAGRPCGRPQTATRGVVLSTVSATGAAPVA